MRERQYAFTMPTGPLEAAGVRGGGVLGEALLGIQGGLELRGFLDLATEVDRDQAERAGDQERDPPAPLLHGALTQGQLQHGDEGGAEGEAEVAAHVQEAGEEAAALVRGVFAHKGGGTGVLAAGGETLDQLEQHQQGRGPHSDLRIAGQQADGEGAGGHQHQRGGEDLLASDLVAEPAEDDSAQGTGDKGGGEGSQQEQGLHGLVGLRQEHRSHGGDQVAEHADVVPLHGVTHDGSAECFLKHRLVDDVDVGDFEPAARQQPRLLGALGRAILSVPRALFTPAEESVMLRSLGIWAAPVEVICLRLVAAPLRAGFQFYAISMAFPSSVAYDPAFQARIRLPKPNLFCAVSPRQHWKSGGAGHRYQTFSAGRPKKPPKYAGIRPLHPEPGRVRAARNPSKTGVSNGPDHCLRLSHGNTDLWIGPRPPAVVPAGLSRPLYSPAIRAS